MSKLWKFICSAVVLLIGSLAIVMRSNKSSHKKEVKQNDDLLEANSVDLKKATKKKAVASKQVAVAKKRLSTISKAKKSTKKSKEVIDSFKTKYGSKK